MWIAVLLLACGTEVVPAPAPAPAPVPADEPDPAPMPVEIKAVDGKDYGAKWLIILSSSKEEGRVPDGVEGLADMARLQSSQFKGLMPCYEIVVAGAFEKKKGAVARSKELKAEGIDNYTKPAGQYIGDDSRLEAYCGGEVETACNAAFRFVETHGENQYMDLALDAVAAERAAAQAPAEARLEESTVWLAELAVETVEDWSVGQALEGYAADGTPHGCKIAGFSTLTRGTPHFGWFESDQSQPGCGSSQVFAALDCDEEVRFAIPADRGGLSGFTLDAGKVDSKLAGSAQELLRRDAGYQRVHSRAAQRAAEEGEDLGIDVSVVKYVGKKASYLVVTAHLTTGDGNDWCGADDLNLTVSGVISAPQGAAHPELVVPFREMGAAAITGLVDVERDGTVEVILNSWPERTAVATRDGTEICAVEIDYCDCPC